VGKKQDFFMKIDYYLGLSEEGFHKISFTEWGSPAQHEIPVICTHGLTRNGRDFDALAAYLETHSQRHVYCPDIVGRGDSDWLKDSSHYTYEQYIADLNVLIALTRAKQIDWIGTSMGGILGMLLASMPGSPIRRLVLNDVGAQIPVKALSRLSKYAGQDPEFSSLEEAERYFKVIYADFGQLSEEKWQQLTKNSVREMTPGKFVTKIDNKIKSSPAKSKIAWQLLLNPRKALEGTVFDIDLWHIWRKITCPVLLIHGSHSDLLLMDIIKKMRSIHPGTELLEVSDAGHAPALLDPAQMEVIDKWLK
jgi:pimeloyl-ACP methyl ester carboxylesterase